MVEGDAGTAGGGGAVDGGRRRFALMLNDRAKRVSADVRERLSELVPPEDRFFSRSMEEAQEITEEIMRRRYPIVFTGGGDGTVIDFMDRITRVAEAMPDVPPPAIGILRLGTGNGLAQLISSGDFRSDIKSYVANGFQDTQTLALIECEGRRFPFAGLGWDAEILNDYIHVKQRYGTKPVVGKMVQNVGGYFAAFFLKTAPRMGGRLIHRKHAKARIVNLGERAYRLGTGGVVRRVIAKDEVFYEGRLQFAMVGTSPYYGFALKVMPFAGLTPNFMHLRMGSMGASAAVRSLRKVWTGEWEHPQLYDYYVRHVRIDFTEDMPFQIGGDGTGWRRSADFAISKASVQLVRFI